MTSINKFIAKRQMIERIRLVGPNDKSQEVMRALADKGYRLIQSGPYTTKTMFPKVDPDHFLIHSGARYLTREVTKWREVL